LRLESRGSDNVECPARRDFIQYSIDTMTRWTAYLVLSTALLWGNPAAADCMKEALSSEEMNICQHAQAKVVEYKLTELVKAIIARFEGDQELRFILAQTQWRAMMEKDCELEADFYEGADVYPAILSRCMQNHYQSRITQISNYLCPEHSLSKSCDRAEKFFEKSPKP